MPKEIDRPTVPLEKSGVTKVRDMREFQENGLLWLINSVVFNPRGYTIGFSVDKETRDFQGWFIIGDGSEQFYFPEDPVTDALFLKAKEFLSADHGDSLTFVSKKPTEYDTV